MVKSVDNSVMLFDLPDDETLYAALLAKDPSYEGRVWVGVKSTGIFCRLSCSARKPLAKNCVFLESVQACVESGFRPCKRCKPLHSAAATEPVITDLLAALEGNPEHRWSEGDIIARGHDPSTARRAFKRQFGVTFLEMARHRRVAAGSRKLAQGQPVIEAQLEAGFDSASGFRSAFSKLTGLAPSALTGDERLKADWISTTMGPMIAVSDKHHLYLLEFADRKALATELKRLAAVAKQPIGLGRYPPTEQIEAELKRYFAGEAADFKTPVAEIGTDFTRAVWAALREIPVGETRSYSDIAKAINKPSAVRAVARANGANQLALIIPCHRVIGADGSLTGYGGGLWRKQMLLELENNIIALETT